MKDWLKTTLKSLIDLKTGFPFKSEDYTNAPSDIKLLRGDNIVQGALRWDDVKRWSSSDTESFQEYLLKAGDVVVAMDRPWITAGLKQARISEADLPCLQVQRTARLRGKGTLRTDYLRYLIADERFTSYVKKVNTGSGVPHISGDQIKDFPVFLPPPETQQKIAAVLSALDAKIELNNRINEELEGSAKLLYDYWFVQFDFPISASQAADMRDPTLEGKPYRQSGGKMTYNKILKREIPEGWENGNLEFLGRVVGGSTPSTEKPEFFSKDGTPWITPKDLSDNNGKRFINHGATDVTEAGIKAASLKILPAGTVLLSSRAPIGYLAIARNPVTTNQGFKSFIPSEGFSTDYVYFTLDHSMNLIKANASGSTFKEISGGTLKLVRVHLPPPELVSSFTAKASVLSNQQSILEQQNQHLTELRDWLLPMLMNGQITVQDPDHSNRRKKGKAV